MKTAEDFMVTPMRAAFMAARVSPATNTELITRVANALQRGLGKIQRRQWWNKAGGKRKSRKR